VAEPSGSVDSIKDERREASRALYDRQRLNDSLPKMQSNAFHLRPALKSECRRIAELYRVSSDGVADYIWTKSAAPGEDILDIGRRRYEREGIPFSYQNCKLVELNDAVVGMLVAFPMRVDPNYKESDPVLLPYSVLEEDNSYYICGMAVDEAHRGKGMGKMLLDEAERTARSLGFRKLSLIVFEQNVGARRLYERSGYTVTMRHAVVPHPLIHFTGDALLMVKTI
jgi:ribosomal protein S18 acetylase RimI-like enzyme